MREFIQESFELDEEYLLEMAYTRVDAMERCAGLGEKFIEHFNKIYTEPNCQAVNHWCNEMQGWYNSVKKIALKPKNKHLNRTQMRDWFFTAGSDPSEMFIDMEELDFYNEFIDKLEDTNSVYESIKSIFD